MISKRNNLFKIILLIMLSFVVVFSGRTYAKYKLTRDFLVNFSTAPFDVEVTGPTVEVWNVGISKLSATIVNKNNYPIKANITFNNKEVISTFDIPAGETKTFSDIALSKTIVNGLTSGIYDLVVNVSSPYTTTIKNIKTDLKGTITNEEVYGVNVPGTSTNPYLIYAIEDLVRLEKGVNDRGLTYSGKYVNQARTLDFSNVNSYYNSSDSASFGNLNGNTSDGNAIIKEMTTGNGFYGIGHQPAERYFMGIYNGNNYRVSNLYINRTTTDQKDIRSGLFKAIKDATISDLTVSGNIVSLGDVGGVVAGAWGTCKLNNCHSETNIKITGGNGWSVGGVVGLCGKPSNVTLTDCSNRGNVQNTASTGGLIGLIIGPGSTLTLENCYNTGNVISTYTGENGVNCAAAGLAVKDSSQGATINVKKCYNSGTINGKANVAGLVSITQNNGILNISSSYNIGTLTGTGRIGGLVAWQSKSTAKISITNSYAAGTITGGTSVGGIIGAQMGSSNIIYTNVYYLNTTASSIVGGNNNTTGATADSTMKSKLFAETTLTNDFKYNAGGYPKLKWEK